MSISVDDLVASLTSNHIGQEAMDLSDLQTQLSQTLRYQSAQGNGWGPAPCNTPTTRTPSNVNWSQLTEENRRRSSSVVSSTSRRATMDRAGDIAEEAMETEEVEELLDVTSPMSASSSTHPRSDPVYACSPSSPTYRNHPSSLNSYDSAAYLNFESTSPSQSTFAATDPFYAAAQTPQPASNSFFAQMGHPAQSSPFYIHAQQPKSRPIPYPLSMDTCPRFVTAAGFDG